MAESSQKLPVIEKVGYSLGDAAANFVYQTVVRFQLRFFTDVFGIEAGLAGTLLFVGRIWDAFFDPMMGAIADRTKTRWGRFRPWILWTAAPWGIVFFLSFTAPDVPYTWKLVYACGANIVLMTLYSANNTPYSALMGVMTGDINERASLSTYRFVAAQTAAFLVGGFTLPLVSRFAQGDVTSAYGWQMTALIWSVVSVVFFLICFGTTRERITPDPRQKSSFWVDFSDLWRSGPWIALFVSTIAHYVTVGMCAGSMNYYFEYYLDPNSIFDFLNGLGLVAAPAKAGAAGGIWQDFLNKFLVSPDRKNVAAVGFSVFSMVETFFIIIGILFARPLAARFGKKLVSIAGITLTASFMALFYLLPPTAVTLAFVIQIFFSLSFGPTIPLLWAMMADVADFSEWKTGRRATGIVYASVVFALKAGLALGVAVNGWVLSAYAYQAPVKGVSVVQSDFTKLGIVLVASVFPAVGYFIWTACLFFYGIDKDLNVRIQNELMERRKQFSSQ